MSDMRITKFITLVEDINNSLKEEEKRWGSIFRKSDPFGMMSNINMSNINMSLALIYDYNKLNEYGKVIMENSSISLKLDSNQDTISWEIKYSDKNEFKDRKIRIDAAKDFIKRCRRSENVAEGYKFIFWAMMILTVDKQDLEEHLSLICDFVRMLRISDIEMQDIIYVIKSIYNQVDEEYTFKSEDIMSIFGELPNLYTK